MYGVSQKLEDVCSEYAATVSAQVMCCATRGKLWDLGVGNLNTAVEALMLGYPNMFFSHYQLCI